MKNLSLKTLALGILALFAVTTVSAQEEPAKKKNKFGLANRVGVGVGYGTEGLGNYLGALDVNLWYCTFLWWVGAPKEYLEHSDADDIHRGGSQFDMGCLRVFLGFLYRICRYGQSIGLRHRRFR